MSACVVEPLERLADEVRAFVQRPELRALHVAADAHLAAGALQVLLGAEHLADNRSPWLSAEVDTHRDDAWTRIDAQLVREHETRCAAGAPLVPLPTDVPGAPGPGRCAARMRQCAASVKEPARGLVVLLLVRGSTVAEPWLSRLGEMLLDPALGTVRVVVLTSLCPAALAWSDRLTPSICAVHRCELDEAAVTEELAAEVEADARGGGTWPATAKPPPRAGAPEPPPRQPTVEEQLRGHVKRALLGMRREDGPEAVREQTAARDLCRDAGRLPDAVRMELVLGGYLMRLRQPERAQESFDRAAKAAGAIDERALEAQARYAEAFVWRERRRTEDAIRCYWAGIEAAKRGRHVRLVFDGYWEAGQLLRPLDQTSALVSLWSDAIRTAGEYPPAQLRKTRLEAVVHALAEELRRLRRGGDARAVEEWLAHTLGEGHAPSGS
jgi:tetratricopeptide (TPR) repeat protein